MTAEQPSVESLVERVRRGFAEYDDDTEMVVDEASAALDSLTAALERAERLMAEEQKCTQFFNAKRLEAETRVQKAEAVVEAARQADPFGFVENQSGQEAVAVPLADWRKIQAALTAYDEPPTEQIPGAGQEGC